MKEVRPDLRPRCGWCGRLWSPREGVDASQALCPHCRRDRHTLAARLFAADGKERTLVGRYLLRVPKNASRPR